MFRFLKRNDSEVITPEVVDVPVMTIQSNIAMALALCMEEYLRSVSKTSVDIPNRDTLVREYTRWLMLDWAAQRMLGYCKLKYRNIIR